uniref:Twinfilin-2-like n=1 Tax=Petromyzon marinus TaxID=7757 RepID=A0AAJ7TWT1_PETMA|nr:twinfilin-2-like [Petromyzon marinus]
MRVGGRVRAVAGRGLAQPRLLRSRPSPRFPLNSSIIQAMSHQTGIVASQDLRDFLGRARGGDVRLIKIAIDDGTETLVLADERRPEQAWDAEYDALVQSVLEPEQPCYLLYRLDSQNPQGHEWLFITWCPDSSPVRQKMLYAATRATVKKEFGGGHIKEELYGTEKEEVSLSGYKKHIKLSNAPNPLTAAEAELQKLKLNEVKTDISVDSKQQTLQGVSFPIQERALQALQRFSKGEVNYVQLSVDLDKETINLEHAKKISVAELPRCVPEDAARYHFFIFPHSHEGDRLESTVFIYSMPGYKCSIKERMLYSSCKGPLIDTVEQKLGLDIARKIEIENRDELTEDFLYEEVHPKQHAYKPAFAKPRGPTGKRGVKRITKSPGEGGGDD